MTYKLPEGCSGLSYAGKTVAVANDGTVDLAPAAAADLLPHGIAAAVAPASEPPPGDDAKSGKRPAK